MPVPSIRVQAANNPAANNNASVTLSLLASDYLVVELFCKDGSDPTIALATPTANGVGMTPLAAEYVAPSGVRRRVR